MSERDFTKEKWEIVPSLAAAYPALALRYPGSEFYWLIVVRQKRGAMVWIAKITDEIIANHIVDLHNESLK